MHHFLNGYNHRKYYKDKKKLSNSLSNKSNPSYAYFNYLYFPTFEKD